MIRSIYLESFNYGSLMGRGDIAATHSQSQAASLKQQHSRQIERCIENGQWAELHGLIAQDRSPFLTVLADRIRNDGYRSQG
ncbi:MAG: hypothetical protein SFU25_02520, partial [Candidatus Caenarcaniphilales bacterium]|nr:hypothetical protein [Candidatus Caenarcaniphilales bacterium]